MTKPFTPVPKPVSTKKAKGTKSKLPSKSVNMEAVAEKKTRQEQNARNRDFGKETERRVAKKLDSPNGSAERTPMSGAIKQGNFNLTGDVTVRNAMHNNIMKLEIKASSSTDSKGEKQINIKQSWLSQMSKEAREAHEIGALLFHFKGDTKDWFIFDEENIILLIEMAKLGCLYEATIEKDAE